MSWCGSLCLPLVCNCVSWMNVYFFHQVNESYYLLFLLTFVCTFLSTLLLCDFYNADVGHLRPCNPLKLPLLTFILLFFSLL